MCRYIVLILCLLPGMAVMGQREYKKVLLQPSHFEKPIDYSEIKDGAARAAEWLRMSGTELNTRWIVYSDRENNELYDSPEATKPKAEKLGFMQACAVLDTKGDYLLLMQDDPDNIKPPSKIKDPSKVVPLGWVKRENLLLWERALVDPVSKVTRKALIVTKDSKGVEDVYRTKSGDDIPVYKRPDSKKAYPGPTVFTFFYVFKKEGDFYLLSRAEKIGTHNSYEVEGWFHESRCFRWDTRMALEPNIFEDGFTERQNNKNFLATHYEVSPLATRHGQTGITQKDGLVRDAAAKEGNVIRVREYQIPDKEDPKGKATKTIRGATGEVMRFPIVNVFPGESYQTFASGRIQVGEKKQISEEALGIINRSGREQLAASENWNVVLLIEGTAAMDLNKQVLMQALKEVSEYAEAAELKLRTSAVIYRHILDGDSRIKVFEKTASETLIRALEKESLRSMKNPLADKGVFFYGMEEALSRGGFAARETNILIHVGSGGDVRNDRLLKMKYRDDKAMLDDERRGKLYQKIALLNVQMLSIQLSNGGDDNADRFLEDVHDLILTAGQDYSRNENKKDAIELGMDISKWNNPNMSLPTATDEYQAGSKSAQELRNTGELGRVFSPGKGKTATAAQVHEEMMGFLQALKARDAKLAKETKDIMAGKAITDVEDPDMQQILLNRLMKNLHGKLTKEERQALTETRVQIMIPTYVPMAVKGMRTKLYTKVILLNDKELDGIITMMGELNDALRKPDAELREALYETLYNMMAKNFLGEELSRQEFNKKTYPDLASVMLGVSAKGGALEFPYSWSVKDILSKTKVPDDKIREFANYISANHKILNTIRRAGDRYPFLFKRREFTYYWIPIDFTL